jgi:putative endonuclease
LGLLSLIDRLRHAGRRRCTAADLATGRRGEDLAQRYLQQRGYTVVARNYRTRSGDAEVDLIARDGEALVFVEVKSRHSSEFGAPDRAVDREKWRHIVRAAREYTRRADFPWNRVRFDLVNVILGEPPAIEHRQDAFNPPRSTFPENP